MFAKLRSLIAALWEYVYFLSRFTFLAEKKLAKLQGTDDTEDDVPAIRCDNCTHWDWEEGQAALAQNPEFWNRVAPYVTPQRMMERYDDKGELIPSDVEIKAKENGWVHFGACAKTDACTHRSYSCKLFQLRKKPVTVVS